MRRHRTTPVSALALVLLLAAGAAGTATAGGERAGAKPAAIVFPLVAKVQYWDNYGDARTNGAHAGIDMMAPRRAAVVAAEAGRIKWWTTSARAGCMLYLYGASGTTYLYIHLNNDATLRNDNRGGCKAGTTYVAADGAKVAAGQLIAWNGDSGDADGNPHLHFEVHPADGADVNPMPYLARAERLLFPARPGARFTVGLRGVPVAAGNGVLELSVNAVRWWPGGRWTEIDARPVEIVVPADAVVDAALLAALQAPERRTLASRKASQLTVFTAPADASAEAMRGQPSTLTAARVVSG